MYEQSKKRTAIKYSAGAAASVAGLKALGGAGILKTAVTLFVSLGLYAFVYGWGYAAIVILLILIHEMGHWIYMKMKGLNPQAPVFVPFFGAFVAMSKLAEDEATDAWVAFWGPFIGGLGAVAVFFAGELTNNSMLVAGAGFGFFLNFLQLVPVKPLDGGFIAGALSKWLIIPGTIIILLLGFFLQSPLMLVLGAASAISLFQRKKQGEAKPGFARKEFQTQSQALTQVPDSKAIEENTSTSAQETELTSDAPKIPATTKQRIAIGVAYVSLALSLGLMQFVVDYQLHFNKQYAEGQITYLSEQLTRSQDIELYRDRSQYYEIVGKISQAESDLEHVIAANRAQFDDYLAYARFRFTQGHLDAKTGDALNQALALSDPQSQDNWILAYDYLLGNEYKKALQAAKRCDESGANDIKAFVFFRTGKIKEAHASSILALKDPPNPLYAYCHKALMEISEHEMPLAKVDLEEISSADPDDPLALLMFGWYSLYSGDLKAAVKYADESMNFFADPAHDNVDKFHILAACHRLKACAYEKMGKQAKSDADKQSFAKLSTSEMVSFNSLPGYDIYVPANIASIN